VTSITNIGQGKIGDTSGYSTFPIFYKAIVFRPFRGEVVDGIVKSITKFGFFVNVGPLTIFVSRHGIPDDMQYDNNHTPERYVSEEAGVSIQEDKEVRLKITGVRAEAQGLFAIGTIKDDYLGSLS
jgi:DNA-directed RNA polymerase II subunit RPB7